MKREKQCNDREEITELARNTRTDRNARSNTFARVDLPTIAMGSPIICVLYFSSLMQNKHIWSTENEFVNLSEMTRKPLHRFQQNKTKHQLRGMLRMNMYEKSTVTSDEPFNASSKGLPLDVPHRILNRWVQLNQSCFDVLQGNGSNSIDEIVIIEVTRDRPHA